MKWKLWLRHLSVSGPHVAIGPRLPWPVRALGLFVAMVVAALVGLQFADRRAAATQPDLQRMRADLAQSASHLERAIAERDRQAALVVQHESQMQIDQAAQQQLRQQLRTLEGEVARLKADLAFFESLLPAPTDTKGVAIRSFRLQADDEPNRYRYRLLVQQNGKPARDFSGDVVLVVNLQQGGRGWTLQLPDPAAPDAGPAPLSFRHYQRIEGSFALPVGSVVRSVNVRIVSGGETQTQQTFTM